MLVLVGVNHRTAPVKVREQYHFPEPEIAAALQHLRGLPTVEEALLFSTCNRVEIFARVENIEHGVEQIKAFLQTRRSASAPVSAGSVETEIYVHQERDAVRHLFRVASSLDSLVVGEPQILGQVKNAFRLAMDAGATGSLINRCMHRAFHVAKRVRSETSIGRYPISVASVAVDLATRIFEDVKDQVVLLVGAGEVMEETAERLQQAGVSELLVTSRTQESASRLASKFQGTTFYLEKLPQHLPRADIVLTALGAVEPVITADMVQRALEVRQQKPLLLVDLSVPRVVAEQVTNVDNAFLYNIDDLAAIVEENRAQRQGAVMDAEAIIERECAEFEDVLEAQGVLPVIAHLHERAESIVEEEIERTLRRIGSLSEDQKDSLRVMGRAIARKILHAPVDEIRREAAKSTTDDSLVRLVRKLFRL